MSDPRLRLQAPRPAPLPAPMRRPIGRHLVERGSLAPRDLLHALNLQHRQDAPLGDILIAEGLATEDQVLEAVARQHGRKMVDLGDQPPDPRLIDLLPPETWLRLRMVPWMRIGRSLVLATPRPDLVDRVRALLPADIEIVLTVVASETQVLNAISARCPTQLADRAQRRVPVRYSCRTWQDRDSRRMTATALGLAALATLATMFPAPAAQAVSLLAILTLAPVAGLKILAFFMQVFGRLHDPPTDPPGPVSEAHAGTPALPRISILVPLFREREIAGALITRLRRVRYPRALLDVVLVLEDRDLVTRAALDACDLPHWMRAVSVPEHGPLTTKPRALNYALDFCQGDIVGVWDAEDAPAPDQLHEVAARFAIAAPDVACLQGVLDYYNPRSNWLARCFTIEYAGWWRVLLPGIARLGLVLPLGGTTLFFRRRILEEIGAWDAHNVTEDADLGIRLAREGYRTELIATVTHEEANCRLLPWIRQRSRWLKGFLITWLVHMRRPGLLLKQLGFWRCLGVHTLMAGTVLQFLLAPVLWSLWLLALGLPHPLSAVIGPGALAVLGGACVVAEAGNLMIAAAGVSGPRHRFLLPWVPLMPVYFALGTAAALKAMWELLLRPHFWDKTRHGIARPDIMPGHPGCPHPDADGS